MSEEQTQLVENETPAEENETENKTAKKRTGSKRSGSESSGTKASGRVSNAVVLENYIEMQKTLSDLTAKCQQNNDALNMVVQMLENMETEPVQSEPAPEPVKPAEPAVTLENYLEMQKTVTDLSAKCQQNNDVLNKVVQMLENAKAAPAQEPEKPAEPAVAREGCSGFREIPEPAPANPDMANYMTSKDVFNTYSKQMARRDGELANTKLAHLMEKVCLMREDYIKLCNDIKKNVNMFSGNEVLKSFEAYLIDIENMLTDVGITIGHYGGDGDKIDTLHQRIVGVVPTRDPAKNGMIAERLSESYELGDRNLVKEKVNVYKLTDTAPQQATTGFREMPNQ